VSGMGRFAVASQSIGGASDVARAAVGEPLT
jgi:hypothetical protein